MERFWNCERIWVKTTGSSRAILRVSEQDLHLCELRTVPEIPQLQTMVDVKGQLQALSPRSSTKHILFNK